MMKKVYEAPAIMFEDFSLTTNIAGNCEVIISNHTQSSGCAYVYNDGRGNSLSVFTDTMGSCTYKPANGDYNGLCYHVPYESNNLFNS